MIISDNKNIGSYKNLFGDGSSLGMNISYCIQESPNGIAESLILAEDFIGNDNIALILGDNIFYGNKLDEKFKEAMQSKFEATIFGIRVKNPSDFGVIIFMIPILFQLIHKPENPKSNIAITGIYFYKNNAINYAKQLKPSSRGELEITDLNNIYLNKNQLNASIFQRGIAWLDTGSHESLLQAGQFIRTIEDRQGIKIGCIEEVAYRNNWITKDSLLYCLLRNIIKLSMESTCYH